MVQIPPVLPTPSAQAMATFPSTEIAEGTGIVSFFGADTEDNGTTTHFLTNNVIHSDQVGTSGTETLDIDFDSAKFNFPKRMKGTFRAVVPLVWGLEASAAGGFIDCKVLVRHFDGSTETEIASNTKSRVGAVAATNDTVQDVFVIEIPITTAKHFKKGEQLRVTVQVTGQVSSTKVGLFHDPKDRSAPTAWYDANGYDSGEFITSKLEFQVPFLIDI